MTVLITLTIAGTDSGPFDLYSDLDGYTSAFESGVSKASLLAGYASALVPDYTNIIRVKSNGDCVNYIDIPLPGYTTTTTTTFGTCYEFESDPYTTTFTAEYIDCNGIVQIVNDTCVSAPCTYLICAESITSSSELMSIVGICTTTTTTTLI